MNAQLGWGIAVVIIAGVVNGSFAAPMKRMPSWRWENSWLMFAITGLVIFPWIIAYAHDSSPGRRLFQRIVAHTRESGFYLDSCGALEQRCAGSGSAGWAWRSHSR